VHAEFAKKLEQEQGQNAEEQRRARNLTRKKQRRQQGIAPPSTKNRIRSIERTLQRKGHLLPPEAQEKMRERLAALRQDFEGVKLAEREKMMATRYRRVKFFERKKLQRRLQQTIRQCSDASLSDKERARLSAQRRQLVQDLQYVMYFPRDMKYVSILSNPRAETDALRATPEFQEKSARARQLVLAYRAMKLKRGADPGVPPAPPTGAAEARAPKRPLPADEDVSGSEAGLNRGRTLAAKRATRVADASASGSEGESEEEEEEEDSRAFVQRMREEQQRNLKALEARLARGEDSSGGFVAPDSGEAIAGGEYDHAGGGESAESAESAEAGGAGVPELKAFVGGSEVEEDSAELRRKMRYDAAENCLAPGEALQRHEERRRGATPRRDAVLGTGVPGQEDEGFVDMDPAALARAAERATPGLAARGDAGDAGESSDVWESSAGDAELPARVDRDAARAAAFGEPADLHSFGQRGGREAVRGVDRSPSPAPPLVLSGHAASLTPY